MYTRQITSEEIYVMSEARKIINTESKSKRSNILYFAKQKLFGFLLIIIAIAMPIVFDGDITISLFTFPLGCYLLLTKGKVIY